MSAVGETPNGLEFIRISSHIPKNIQEGSADIIFENNDILSHPKGGGALWGLANIQSLKGSFLKFILLHCPNILVKYYVNPEL